MQPRCRPKIGDAACLLDRRIASHWFVFSKAGGDGSWRIPRPKLVNSLKEKSHADFALVTGYPASTHTTDHPATITMKAPPLRSLLSFKNNLCWSIKCTRAYPAHYLRITPSDNQPQRRRRAQSFCRLLTAKTTHQYGLASDLFSAQEPVLRYQGDPMAKTKTLSDLFHDTLKDIYFAEKKIMSALPKMAKAAQSDELRAAFENHLEETEGQVDRLEAVFEEIGETARGKTCDAIMGILDEGKEIMSEYKGAPALDAGLLAAAQAVEHYEISRYGTLITWAGELGLTKASSLLKETLAEEKKTDQTLTGIAKSVVNAEAEAA